MSPNSNSLETSTRKFWHHTYLNGLLYSIILLMGSMVMFGRVFEIDRLVNVLPDLAPMQFNNALCFILLGASGIASMLQSNRILTLLGVTGLMISGLTLAQYLFHTDFGFDLLFMDTKDINESVHPGRMAPNSALAHLLAFTSLLLMTRRTRMAYRVACWLGAVVAAAGVVSFAGYLIAVDGGFNWGSYSQMTLYTSIGFIVFGSAIGITGIPKRMYSEGQRFLLWPYEILVLATVFFIDLQLPQGIAVGLLYVMPLLTSWFFPNRNHILVVAFICNGLIALDVVLATASLDSDAVFYNRIMSILAVWVAAGIFYYLKKLVEQQKDADMKFKLAVEGTTAGIWDWVSTDDIQQWWSPQFYKLLGYQDQEIESNIENFRMLLHPDDHESTFKLVEDHFFDRALFQIEYRLRHKSGKYKWFQGAGKAQWDSQGKATRMVGTIIDINAHKLAEMAEEERSQQLAEKNKELEEFTYVASHDLQEPVRTISSFVELFRQNYADKLDDEAIQYLDFMDGASRRSQQLIKDLLDYSRIGKTRELEQVNLDHVLENVLDDLTLRINQSKATITADKLPTVEGQRTELRLLFQNLISNAIKFRKKDELPRVHISVEKNEDEYIFSTTDNGIGIVKKYMDRIFVIFKRLHGRSEFEGTGIGLAHSKKVVEMHGGRIWVESVIGKGSTFKFSLPTHTMQ